MIEIIIKDYLENKLEEPVFLEHPDKNLKQFVLIEKTGSSKKNHLPSSVFAIQSYGSSMYAAAELNERVKEAIEGIICLDSIRGIQINSDYNFTDVTTKRHRYQAVYNIKHY